MPISLHVSRNMCKDFLVAFKGTWRYADREAFVCLWQNHCIILQWVQKCSRSCFLLSVQKLICLKKLWYFLDILNIEWVYIPWEIGYQSHKDGYSNWTTKNSKIFLFHSVVDHFKWCYKHKVFTLTLLYLFDGDFPWIRLTYRFLIVCFVSAGNSSAFHAVRWWTYSCW